MYDQEYLRKTLCEPIVNVGATDAVTGTDLRRFADNLASIIAGPEPPTGSIENVNVLAEPEPEIVLQPGKAAIAAAATSEAEETVTEE